MHKEGHKKLHGKKIKIFEDKSGNKLYKKPVKEVHTTWQLTATNNKGKVVGLKGVKAMIGKAKRSSKSGKSGFWNGSSPSHIGIKLKSNGKTPSVLSSKPLKQVYD